MLGWSSTPPVQHRSSGKSYLPNSHEIVHFFQEDEKPVLQSPHQIVIGFDLGADSRKAFSQSCESPRSVLEPELMLCSQARRATSSFCKSPLSALGSLLADCARVGNSSCKVEKSSAESSPCHTVSKTDNPTYHDYRLNACRNLKSDALGKDETVSAPRHASKTSQSAVRARERGHVKPRLTINFSCEDDFGAQAEHTCSLESIFSPASPVSSHHRFESLSSDFLSKCVWCKRKLVKEKDIYMYRGDQAFCSQECRYMRIIVDERRGRE
ncbi:hypothetical protein KP509_28G049900 [Ceratopteris richardii]|uniref:FLZ-type domain-containing protein n=1 Tax=Ceratopteris richardii TaxID=49495 RepID=A0A8T2RBY1_CERRI|nr:hypothetical protein KP509_28G049900 [Ceratopteris richardii]